MISCPDCGHANIEGSDECEQCQQPLHDTHLVPPSNTIEEGLLSDRLGALNPKMPITVEASATVGHVLDVLVERGIGCVVVVEQGRTVGIFSERDALLRLSTKAKELKNRPISEFMTPNPRVLDTEAKIAFAVQRMDLGGYRHVPIVDHADELCGVVSARDILRYLTDKLTAVDEP